MNVATSLIGAARLHDGGHTAPSELVDIMLLSSGP